MATPEAQKGILGSGTSPPEARVTVLLAPYPPAHCAHREAGPRVSDPQCRHTRRGLPAAPQPATGFLCVDLTKPQSPAEEPSSARAGEQRAPHGPTQASGPVLQGGGSPSRQRTRRLPRVQVQDARAGRQKRSKPVGIRTPSRSPSPRTSSHHTGPASSRAPGSPRRGKHRQRACAVAHVAVSRDRDPEAMVGQPCLPVRANATPRPHGRSEEDEATCADVPGAGPTRSRRLSRPPSSAWAAHTPPPGPRRTGCTSSVGRARGSLSPRGSEKRTWRPRFR